MSDAFPTFAASRAPESPGFSWPRFVRLALAHWAEQRSQHLAHLLVCGMLYIVLLLFLLGVSSFGAFRTGMQSALYFGGLYLTGFVFAGRYFNAMAQRESALLALMRPASVLEKWLLCLVVVAIAYPVAYSLLYLVITWPVQQMAVAVLAALEPQTFKPQDFALFLPLAPPSDWRELSLRQQLAFLVALWAVQAFAVSGSLYFSRAALLKTLALGFGLFALTSLLASLAGMRGEVLVAWWTSRRSVRLDVWVHALNAALWIGLPILLWLQAYVHLKEKELL